MSQQSRIEASGQTRTHADNVERRARMRGALSVASLVVGVLSLAYGGYNLVAEDGAHAVQSLAATAAAASLAIFFNNRRKEALESAGNYRTLADRAV